MPECPICNPPQKIDLPPKLEEIPPTAPFDEVAATEPLFNRNLVAGWLICIEGINRGKDFRLHAGRNFIGRDLDQDVRLEDGSVSRKHFVIDFNPIEGNYCIEMNNAKAAAVYVNGSPLNGKLILERGDRIKLARTELIFIPLDQECVKWDWTK